MAVLLRNTVELYQGTEENASATSLRPYFQGIWLVLRIDFT